MYEYAAKVRSIYDGDTCRLDIDLGCRVWLFSVPIRLLGINAPELVKGEPRGIESREFLRTLIPTGSTVWIRTHLDAVEKYGRYLAEVFCTVEDMTHDDYDLSVNSLMVTVGHAVAYWP